MADQDQADSPPPVSDDEIMRRALSLYRFIIECRECQAAAPVDWNFCASCGGRLATDCPGCGQPLPPFGARFCPHCGLEIPESLTSEHR